MEKREIFSSAGGFRVEDSDLNPLIRSIDGTMDSGDTRLHSFYSTPSTLLYLVLMR